MQLLPISALESAAAGPTAQTTVVVAVTVARPQRAKRIPPVGLGLEWSGLDVISENILVTGAWGRATRLWRMRKCHGRASSCRERWHDGRLVLKVVDVLDVVLESGVFDWVKIFCRWRMVGGTLRYLPRKMPRM